LQQDQPAPAHEPSPIFFGPNGLRAGWSLIIAIVLVAVLFPTINSLIRATHIIPPHAIGHFPGPLSVLIIEIAGLLVTAIVTRIMGVIEHRETGLYGLGGSGRLRNLLMGALVGIIAITLLILILIKAGLLAIDSHLLSGSEALKYSALWLLPFLAIGLFEEYLFRGYLQYTLARGLSGLAKYISPKLDPQAFGFWAAAIIVSFGFGAVHGTNPGESPLGLVTAGLAALLFCFSLWRTGSLWWAIGMHAAWDYGQSFVFGVADSGTMIGHRLLKTHPLGAPLFSGGATGPEGSILCLPVLLALALVVHFTQPITATSYASRMPQPELPPAPPREDTAIAS
jgi:membrane protease YdiL (CAAX protease family)